MRNVRFRLLVLFAAFVAVLFSFGLFATESTEAAFGESQVAVSSAEVVLDLINHGDQDGGILPLPLMDGASALTSPPNETAALRLAEPDTDSTLDGMALGAGIDVTDPTWIASLMLTDDIDTSGIDRGGGTFDAMVSFEDPIGNDEIIPISLTDGASGLTTSLESTAVGTSDTVTTNNGGLAALAITEIFVTETTQDASLAVNEANQESRTLARYDADEQPRTKIPITLGMLGGLTALFGLVALAIRGRATFARIVASTARPMQSRARGVY